MTPKTKKSKWPYIISFLLIGGLVATYFIFPAFKDQVNESYNILTSGNEQKISSWVNEIGFWGPVFIIMAMILQMFLLIVPSPLLMVVSVLAYGPYWGAAIAVIAIFCSASIGYWIGKYVGEVAIYRLIGRKKEKQLEFYVERYGFWAVFITRLSPLLSNDAISFVGGILRMGYWKFIAATLSGIIPLAALIAYFGENNERLKTGLIWVTIVSAIIFIAYIIWDRKKNPVHNKSDEKK